MATYKSLRYKGNTLTDSRTAGTHSGVTSVSFTAALAAADVLKVIKLPREATLVNPGGWFLETAADLDTATNLTISLIVTDGSTTKTIISASTIGQGAAGRVNADDGNGSGQVGWLGFETTNEDFEVRLLVAAGPSTATSGTFTVGWSYTMDQQDY